MEPFARDKVLECIVESLEGVLEARSAVPITNASEDTALFGSQGCLDSMGLVMLIMDVEQWLNDNSDHTFVLVDAKAMSRNNSPFQSIGSMVDFIMTLAKEAEDNA